MEFQLISVEEREVRVRRPTASESTGEFVLNWSFDLDLIFPRENTLVIRLESSMLVTAPEGHPNIADFATDFRFHISSKLSGVSSLESNKKLFNHVATLLGVSLGTVRGLVLARTAAIFGPGVIMPVVHPSEMLRQQLPTLLQKEAQRNVKAESGEVA